MSKCYCFHLHMSKPSKTLRLMMPLGEANPWRRWHMLYIVPLPFMCNQIIILKGMCQWVFSLKIGLQSIRCICHLHNIWKCENIKRFEENIFSTRTLWTHYYQYKITATWMDFQKNECFLKITDCGEMLTEVPQWQVCRFVRLVSRKLMLQPQ